MECLPSAGHQAFLVRILNAKDKFTTHLPGVKVIVQRGSDAAQMHKAGGGGREAGTDFHDGVFPFVILR